MLASNIPEVEMECHPCPGNHQHLKWGQITINNKRVFATSTEKHYPTGLCAYIAKVVLFVYELYKLHLPMNSLQTMNADLSKVLSMARAQTSQFSRTKLPQLVAEYKEVIKAIHNDPNINEGAILAASFPAETTMGQIIHMPPGAKLLTKLHHDKKGGGNDDANFARCSQGV